ncbi:uncharacterized protein LOC127121682 [Lathyrus oleraceus]|uniref:uncharacterized protein LOC127121682 n=1 Tax=Pisum sativum TaxID=3888 RepID=UPI0021D0F629|nr:uncharacterized protein LOC127121682 [Pisum sativum]
MSQHQTTSASKTTKSTHKVSAPSMDIHDDEILDVVPLSVIPCEALDLNHPMDASTSACLNQGNISSIPSILTHATNSKEDIHHIDRVIRNLVTRILNEGHSVKGVSTPLSKMYLYPKVEQHSEKNNNSSSSEKDMAAEEDDRSDDQEDSLLHHLKPSVAKRMKTRKGGFVAELMSVRKTKKTVGIGPSKSWSKVEVKKRKVREDSESEEDVEEDVPDISHVKKTTVRKSPGKVVVVHLDNISFHLEDGVAKWKFVITRRVAMERELGKDVVEVKEVMDLIKAARLLKTVAGFSQCYKGLVKEFIANIPEDIADKNNKEFCKVFVRGSHVEDIVMTSAMKKSASKVRTIAELKETCKELGEGIRVATARKQSLKALIASLEQAEGENMDHAKEAEAHTSSKRSATNDETSGNSVSSVDEAASSSSSD